VFGAISVATACLLPGSPAAQVAAIPEGACKTLAVEHPTGALEVLMEVAEGSGPPEIKRAAFLRTARKLFQGTAYPGSLAR
jgi:4-oxalomesaconate tautomerase